MAQVAVSYTQTRSETGSDRQCNLKCLPYSVQVYSVFSPFLSLPLTSQQNHSSVSLQRWVSTQLSQVSARRRPPPQSAPQTGLCSFWLHFFCLLLLLQCYGSIVCCCFFFFCCCCCCCCLPSELCSLFCCCCLSCCVFDSPRHSPRQCPSLIPSLSFSVASLPNNVTANCGTEHGHTEGEGKGGKGHTTTTTVFIPFGWCGVWCEQCTSRVSSEVHRHSLKSAMQSEEALPSLPPPSEWLKPIQTEEEEEWLIEEPKNTKTSAATTLKKKNFDNERRSEWMSLDECVLRHCKLQADRQAGQPVMAEQQRQSASSSTFSSFSLIPCQLSYGTSRSWNKKAEQSKEWKPSSSSSFCLVLLLDCATLRLFWAGSLSRLWQTLAKLDNCKTQAKVMKV